MHHLDQAIRQYGEHLPPLLLWEPISEIEQNEAFQMKRFQIFAKLDQHHIPYVLLNSNDDQNEWETSLKSFLKKTNLNTLELRPFPGYTRAFPEKIDSFVTFLTQITNARTDINIQTIGHFSRIWTHNYQKNDSLIKARKADTYLLNSIQMGQKLPVFVGASPDLEQEISFLKQHRSELLLLSSDTSVQYLLSESLLPDAILSFDPGRGTLYHFLPSIPSGIPIITWLGGLSEIFSLPNPIYLVNTNHPVDQILEHKLKEPWPSLANPSLNLAGMGKALATLAKSAKFLLSGVSFKGDSGKAHCRGTGYERFRLPQVKRERTWEQLNTTKLYAKNEGKNKLAWDQLWQPSPPIQIGHLKDAFIEKETRVSTSISEANKIFRGIKGFPELNQNDWERAFQEFPEVISSKTFMRWYPG